MNNPSRNPQPNPYAPPTAARLADPGFAKRHRVSLINRRTTAVLLEMAAWRLTGGTLLLALFARGAPSIAWGLAAAVPYWLLRDVIGLSTQAKRLVGLRLVSEGDREGKGPTMMQRLIRNLPLAIPLMSLVEYFVAYYGDAQMRRLGDRMAGTCVVDAAPERTDRGSYTWQLLGALALNWLASAVGAAILASGSR